MSVDFKAQDSLFPTNVRAPRLRCPSVPLWVREERGVVKVSGRPGLKTLTLSGLSEHYEKRAERNVGRSEWKNLFVLWQG